MTLLKVGRARIAPCQNECILLAPDRPAPSMSRLFLIAELLLMSLAQAAASAERLEIVATGEIDIAATAASRSTGWIRDFRSACAN